MFVHGAPRFISPNPPPYDVDAPDALDIYTSLPDPSAHQLALFLSSVQPQLATSTLRSFLRLYTTLGTDKLASFLNVTEEEVLEMLMTAKGAARKFTWVEGSGSAGLLEGQVVGVSDVNFGVDDAHVTVAESKTSRRYGDFFLRHGLKFNDVYTALRNKPLVPKARTVLPSLSSFPVAAAPSSSVTVNGSAPASGAAVWGGAVKA